MLQCLPYSSVCERHTVHRWRECTDHYDMWAFAHRPSSCLRIVERCIANPVLLRDKHFCAASSMSRLKTGTRLVHQEARYRTGAESHARVFAISIPVLR